MSYSIIYVPFPIVKKLLKEYNRDGIIVSSAYNQFVNDYIDESVGSGSFSHIWDNELYTKYFDIKELAGSNTEYIVEYITETITKLIEDGYTDNLKELQNLLTDTNQTSSVNEQVNIPATIPENTPALNFSNNKVVIDGAPISEHASKTDISDTDVPDNLPVDIKMCIFMNVLSALRFQCCKFPNTVMIIDINHPLRMFINKAIIQPDNISTISNKKNKIYMTYHHPDKGKIKLDTKHKASEAYSIEYFKPDSNKELLLQIKQYISEF
jgi:hypothetical protein